MSDSSRDLTALFETVIQIEEADARDEFIEESCGTDSALREQLKGLVEAHERAGNFLKPLHLRETCVTSLPPGSDGDVPHSLHMSVVNLIGQALEGQLPRVVLDSSPDEGPSPIVRPGSAEMPTTKPESRYRLDGEIARGGMGAILKGRDVDLGRDLAVKVLLDQHRNKPSVIQRFVEEAQIGGQLQHPGIVPVYELGQFDDQRPFFTMKLVKGKTLAALLDERRSPEEDRGRFLGIFEQVCQTMAYAHSRRVIHRDLKPSNIMVGAFGEVQVMDWGLAKVLSEGGVADEQKAFDNQTRISIIQTIRSLGSDALTADPSDSAGSQTQMGSVMGTPAYMPPEQALGEIDRLDPRSDVFGLGSILCEILTGSPPYTGESQTDIYRKASRAKLEECFERLTQQNIDEELTQVVRDSLQPEPEDRIRDASVLARRIGNYQASVETRMRDAELAKAEANARAVEERKRRRVVMALAASILATVGLAGGSWAWLKQKDAELARVESERRVEELAEQQKLAQQINSELSTARALASLDEETLPDAESIERARAALTRARSLAESEPVGNEITNSIAKVGEQVEAIGRDFALIAALDKSRENEMEYRARRANWESVQQNKIPMYEAPGPGLDTDREAELFSKPNPAVLYEEAFSEWGLTLSDDRAAIEKLAGRIKSLPPSFYPIALSSLDRWRNLLKAPLHIEEWQQLEWQTLEPVQLKSLGRDRFKVLEDKSILTSGPSPWSGYELSFDTDVTELNAIRLEAMLHSSLQGGGPGRSSTGTFGVDIQVDYAPLDDLENRQPLELGIGDADHGAIGTEVQYGRWMSFGQIPHVAVFPCRYTAKSSSGFRIWIRSAGRERNADVLLWTFGRWGRMRFSIPRANQHARTQSIVGLTSLLDHADSSDWRREMRSEMDRNDVAAAIGRASGNVGQQPNQFRVQLAEFLASRDNRDLDQLWPKNVKWQPLRNVQVKAENGTIYSIDSDGIIEASGPNPPGETVSITGRLPIRGVTAVRLEIIHPQEANRYLGRKPEVSLGEIELFAGSSQSGTFDPIRTTSIMSRRGERAFHSTRGLRFAADGNSTTIVRFEFGENVDQQLVIGLDRGQVAGPDLRISLNFGGLTNGLNPKRFRLSVARDEIQISGLQPAAISLLKQAVASDPSDYFSRIALSKLLRSSLVPNHTEALRHATAAAALRPKSPTAHATIVEALDVRELTKGSPTAQLAIDHVERLRKLDKQHSAIDDLVRKLFDQAIQQERNGQLADAIESCRLAMELRSPNVASYLLLARELGIRKFYPLSLAAAQTAIAVDPEDGRGHFFSGRVFEQLENHKQALKRYRKASKVSPGLTISYRHQADMLAKLNRHDEAIEVLEEATKRSPLEALNFDRLGDRLSDAGKPAEAIAAYRKAVELAPYAMHYQFMLVTKLLAERQPDEAIKVYEDAIAVDPDDFLPRHNLSDLLHMLGRIDPAIEVAREVVKRHPEQRAGYSTLCRLLDMQGETKAARDAFQLGLVKCPAASYLASMYGELLEREKEFAAAIEQYRAAIKVDPNDAFAWSQLAALLERQGQIDAAIELQKTKIALLPTEATPYEQLARLSRGQKRFDEAVPILENAVKLQPDNANLLLSVASGLSVHPESEKLHAARAIELATKAIGLRPQDRATAQHVLGVAQYRAGESKKAAATLKKAYDIRVEAGPASGRAPVLLQMGFRSTPPAVEFGPLLAQTRCFHAMAAFQSGDLEKARQFLSEAEGGIGRMAFIEAFDLTRMNRYEQPDATLATAIEALREARRVLSVEVGSGDRLEQAINAKANFVRLHPLDSQGIFDLFSLLAEAGRLEERDEIYRQAIKDLQDVEAPEPRIRIARGFLLAPSDDKSLLEHAAEVARNGLNSGSKLLETCWIEATLGMAEYRLGRFKQAADTLTRSANWDGDGRNTVGHVARLFRAMALHKLGYEDDAERDFRRVEDKLGLSTSRGESADKYGVSYIKSVIYPEAKKQLGLRDK